MNAATCTTIAQVIPLLLVVSAWMNSRSHNAASNRPTWAKYLDLLGLAAPLVALAFCLHGINDDGLKNEFVTGITWGGLYALLVNIFSNVSFMIFAASGDQKE